MAALECGDDSLFSFLEDTQESHTRPLATPVRSTAAVPAARTLPALPAPVKPCTPQHTKGHASPGLVTPPPSAKSAGSSTDKMTPQCLRFRSLSSFASYDSQAETPTKEDVERTQADISKTQAALKMDKAKSKPAPTKDSLGKGAEDIPHVK